MTPSGPETSPPVVPGAIHRVTVGSVDDRGRGLATLGRRTLRVANALVGETLEVRLVHVGRHIAVGRIDRVAAASPDRVDDRCPHGTECPGCGLRTTSPSRRRAFLRERLVAALSKAGIDENLIEPTVAAPNADGWRWKAFLTARRTKRGLFLGLYEENTHHLLGIQGCPVHAPSVEKALGGARRALKEMNPPAYDERSGQGWLRYVSVRASASRGDAVVTLIATDDRFEGAAALAQAIQTFAPHVTGVVLNVHAERGNAPLGSAFVPLLGVPHLEEASGPFELRVSPGSFFQVNPEVGSLIHDRVAAAARTAPPGGALDLYGGVGSTALRLAADGRTVTLIESAGPAAEDAQENARRHGAGRVTVLAGKVEDLLAAALESRPVVVALNPPRSGLHAAALAALTARRVGLLAYTSCDPASLARDVAGLTAAGYRLQSVTPFELMPQTPHVEALALLR